MTNDDLETVLEQEFGRFGKVHPKIRRGDGSGESGMPVAFLQFEARHSQ